MAIQYYLLQNALSKTKSNKAIIIPNKVHNVQSIIAEMLKRGTTLTEADIVASLHLFFEVVVNEAQKGNNINLPIVNIKPTISGEFKSASDKFDPSVHKTKAKTSTGSVLKKRMIQLPVSKIKKELTCPVLVAFKDVQTQTIDNCITPGGIGIITGKNLKFNAENSNEGIFLIDSENRKTQVTCIASKTQGKILFSIPSALSSGNYTLQVKTSFDKLGINIRKGELATTIKVL
jgi:hypothetical protein